MMKKKLLGMALLGAVTLSQAVAAQEYDNRWYLSGSVGALFTDSGRGASNSELLGVGVGKRFTENFALDVQADRAAPTLDINPILGDQTWYLHSLSVVGRYYFIKEDRTWNPYLAGGLGAFRHHEQRNSGVNRPGFGPGYGGERIGWNAGALVGVGLESDRRKRVDYRMEAGLRYDKDGNADYWPRVPGSDAEFQSHALDGYVTASVLVKLGDLAVPVVAAPAPTCDTLDGDNDGVNDCNDKCPNSEAGQTIGADGCPVKLTIDLKGVNFDFDKATLRPDAVVILDEAVSVLAKYPELKVEVAGHTDLCGKDTYNQDLSQRRAQTVFDYLTGKGIDAGRLMGPTGYGESRPLEATEQTSPACKSETNRRTELNVQN
jgi:OOP family OmpA-OmpF porin